MESLSGKSCSSSWGSIRDSLERMRERNNSMAQTPLPKANNTSIQGVDDDDEEETVQSLPLAIPRPPINRHVVCERYPKGKASVLVFMLNFMVNYAYGVAITGILDIFQTQRDAVEKYSNSSPLERHSLHFVKLLFQYCISQIFYPLAGFLADVYTGRWRMIYLSILFLLTGYVIIVASFTLEGQSSIHLSTLVKYTINGMAYLFLSIGGGAFEATIIPLGVDQLQGASSAEISSYFHFFYFSRNLGMASGIIVSCLLSYVNINISDIEGGSRELYNAFQPLVTTAVLSVGLILMICFHHWFFKNSLWENPVKLIARILCYAATVKRHLPVRNRAFRYGEERKRRIELAKITYDGEFPDDKVEEVKTFCGIVLILLSLAPAMFSVNALDVLISQETNQTLTKLYPNPYFAELYPHIYWGVNTIAIMFILPVVNFLVIPCFPKLTIRARIGIGLVLYCIGSVVVVIIHAVPLAINSQHSTVSGAQIGCLLIPMLIFALGEALTAVSVLEFIYAQSPESMKGLLTGLFYFFLGVASIPSAALYYLYKTSLENKTLLPFYVALTIITVVGTVFYMVAGALYRNRQRHDENSLQRRLIIENQLHSTVTAQD